MTRHTLLLLLLLAAPPRLAAQRPGEASRCFRSEAVEQLLLEMEPVLQARSPKLWQMFQACLPNTLDTTVFPEAPDSLGRPRTFVITGDIHAMWLRDSGAQVWPYLPFAHRDPRLREMIKGVILRQFQCLLTDPYANAFNQEATGGEWQKDYTRMLPEVHERKYELDSLCYPLRLAYAYWQLTGDDSLFDEQWLRVVTTVLGVMREQQRYGGPRTSYTFARLATSAHDTTVNYGRGPMARPCGLIASMFRPSDDSCVLPYLVPGNFFAVSVLRKTAHILAQVNHSDSLAAACRALADEVEQALRTYAVVDHPKYGRVYAYEVDGYGGQLLMDDGNVPSLLSLPYIADVPADDPVYQNTRRMVWSDDNPYFFRGPAIEGVGSPHTGLDMVWPMSLIMKALTATSRDEQEQLLSALLQSDGGTGFMHESVSTADASHYTRSWFAWANTLFGELVLSMYAPAKDITAKP